MNEGERAKASQEWARVARLKQARASCEQVRRRVSRERKRELWSDWVLLERTEKKRERDKKKIPREKLGFLGFMKLISNLVWSVWFPGGSSHFTLNRGQNRSGYKNPTNNIDQPLHLSLRCLISFRHSTGDLQPTISCKVAQEFAKH